MRWFGTAQAERSPLLFNLLRKASGRALLPRVPSWRPGGRVADAQTV